MVGLSYPGISQLFVAATRPPHLAAIAPLSVIDDTIPGTLDAGRDPQHGLRGGLGEGPPAGRRVRPRPRAARGGRRTASRPATRTCEGEPGPAQPGTRPAGAHPRPNKYWTDAIGLPLSPEHFVNRIDVPVYLIGDWQDEQTGGWFAKLDDRG